jgi:FlaA1/EpsC-like NDP-sugar epimerase
MYRKKGRGWTKHIDFMLLDVLCMQIAFIVSYIWRFGPGNPYIDKDYRILAVAFLLIDFFVEIVSDAFKNVLKRGYLDEFIATCKHVALVEIITTFFRFCRFAPVRRKLAPAMRYRLPEQQIWLQAL